MYNIKTNLSRINWYFVRWNRVVIDHLISPEISGFYFSFFSVPSKFQWPIFYIFTLYLGCFKILIALFAFNDWIFILSKFNKRNLMTKCICFLSSNTKSNSASRSSLKLHSVVSLKIIFQRSGMSLGSNGKKIFVPTLRVFAICWSAPGAFANCETLTPARFVSGYFTDVHWRTFIPYPFK